MLKILVVGVSSVKGGIENLFYNLFRKKCSFAEIDFLAFGEECAYAEEYKKNGYNVYVLPTRRENPFLFKKRVKDFFKAHSSYDYVWVNTACTSMYQFQLCAKKYTNGKVITHSHGTKFEQTSGKLFYYLNVILSRLNYNKVVKNTDLFFCCSIAAGIALFGEKYREKLIVINNAIDIEKFAFDISKRQKNRKQLGISEDQTVFAMIGRLCRAKNPCKGVRAFKAFRDIYKNSVFLIIGTGEMENDVLEEIQKLDLQNCVKMLGFRNDVPDLFSAIDVLLMPSLYEGLPLVAVEAQCAGVTCFLSDTISREVALTPLIHFLPLNESDEYWGEEISTRYTPIHDRFALLQNVQQVGYDKNDVLKKVEELLCKTN